jgi:hypothetical protein
MVSESETVDVELAEIHDDASVPPRVIVILERRACVGLVFVRTRQPRLPARVPAGRGTEPALLGVRPMEAWTCALEAGDRTPAMNAGVFASRPSW